jgi:PAS domain S-box-containing protein
VGAEPSFGLEAALEALGTELAPALAEIQIPAYIVDPDLRILWANEHAEALVGPLAGRNALDVVAPESRQWAREQAVARRLSGKPGHYELSLIDRQGRRIPVEISAVGLRDGRTFVGVFGLIGPPGELTPRPPPARALKLTPRQWEVLRLLGHGASTAQISETLGISTETARNHIRALLRKLRQSSRVAAVAYARQHGLL